MRIQRRIFLIFFILCCNISKGQIIIEGNVLDSKNMQPVAYATIVFDSLTGTVCDNNGYFHLVIEKDFNENDSIYISCIGFERYAISYRDYSQLKNKNLKIKNCNYPIESVTAYSKKVKSKLKTYGILKRESNACGYGNIVPGAIVALFIPNTKDEYGIIQNVSFYINPEDIDPNFKLRLHLFSVDTITNSPNMELLTENIIINPEIGKKMD